MNSIDVNGDANITFQNTKGNYNINQIVNFHTDYKELIKKLKTLEDFLSYVPGEDIEKKKSLESEIANIKHEIEIYKENTIKLADFFTRVDTKSNERLSQAKKLFEEGKIREANAVLELNLLSEDQKNLLESKNKLEDKLKDVNKKLKLNSEEYLAKALLTSLDYSNNERVQKSIEYFEKSIKSNSNIKNNSEYADFLQRHGEYVLAETINQNIVTQFINRWQELDIKSQAFIGRKYLNIGAAQMKQNRFREAKSSFDLSEKIANHIIGKSKSHEFLFLQSDAYFYKGFFSFQSGLIAKQQNGSGGYRNPDLYFKEAFDYMQKAKSIKIKLEKIDKNEYMLGLILTNQKIANIYIEQDKLDKGKTILNFVLKKYNDLIKTNTSLIIKSYRNSAIAILGVIYEKTSIKNWERKDVAGARSASDLSINYFTEVINYTLELVNISRETHLPELGNAYNNIGNAYLLQTEFEIDENKLSNANLAIDNLKKALNIWLELNDKLPLAYAPKLVYVNKYLILANKIAKNYEEVSYYEKEFIKWTDFALEVSKSLK